jgi:hypothetical protein
MRPWSFLHNAVLSIFRGICLIIIFHADYVAGVRGWHVVVNIHVDVGKPDVPSEQALAGLAEHNAVVNLVDDLFSVCEELSNPRDWGHYSGYYKLGTVAGYDSWTDY